MSPIELLALILPFSGTEIYSDSVVFVVEQTLFLLFCQGIFLPDIKFLE